MERLSHTIIGTFVSLILVCLIFYIMHPIGQTGEQWLKAQTSYIDDMSMLVDEMDTIVSLYLSDTINESDFLIHIEIIEQECLILQADYQKDAENIPVKTGTHTYFTKLGTENIESLYDNILSVISMLKENSKNKEVLSYKYLAYQQVISEIITEYYLSYVYQFNIIK